MISTVKTLFSLSLFNYALANNSTSCSGPRTPDQIAEFLWEDNTIPYKKRTRPNLAKLLAENSNTSPSLAEPEKVNVSLTVIAVKKIDQQRGEAEFMLDLSFRWNDYRLSYESSDDCYLDGDNE